MFRLIVDRFRRLSWKVNFLAFGRIIRVFTTKTGWLESWRPLEKGLYYWTKSATWKWIFRPLCCGYSKSGSSRRLVAERRYPSALRLLLPPMLTWRARSDPESFGRIFTTR